MASRAQRVRGVLQGGQVRVLRALLLLLLVLAPLRQHLGTSQCRRVRMRRCRRLSHGAQRRAASWVVGVEPHADCEPFAVCG